MTTARSPFTTPSQDNTRDAKERRNIQLYSRRASISLEKQIWDMLETICEREHISMKVLCNRLDDNKGNGSLASGLRNYALKYFRNATSLHRRNSPAEKQGARRTIALDQAFQTLDDTKH